MRHLTFGRKLGRDTNARRALLANLASSLFVNGAIETTLVKAKFVKPYVEKLITITQKNRLSSKRALASVLTHQAFLKLIGEIGPGFANRSGGYTRLLKLGTRAGDNAPMARLELLEIERTRNILEKAKKTKKSPAPKKKSTHRSALKSVQLKKHKQSNAKN